MCGIQAIIGNRAPTYKEKLGDALETLHRRGPDGTGTCFFPHAILGHTRLAIIDAEGGAQPMEDHARRVAVTFNGEIYNYKELRSELETLGHHFVSRSDTEVLLRSYIEYGEECVTHLDGMFAFVVWDDRKQKMFMARDRFGKKPLYYCTDNHGTLLVASEIKALLATGVVGDIDRAALDTYLALGYTLSWTSVYKNISALAPAHAASYEHGVLRTKRYWQLSHTPIIIAYTEAKAELRRLLGEAVRKRMVASDVEVGVLLSGGVDSTLVGLLAQEFIHKPLKTFSLGYGNDIDELPYAREAVKRMQSEHYALQAQHDRLDALIGTCAYFDEPHADSSDAPQYLLSKLAASKVKVVLSGDGADECCLGYEWYKLYAELAAHDDSAPPPAYLSERYMFSPEERKRFWGKETFPEQAFFDPSLYSSPTTELQKVQIFDITTRLPGQMLHKVDRAGMAHSLEVRSPFLDTALFEFAYNLPTQFHLDQEGGKKMLKELLAETMPKEFVYRKKQGFGAPLRAWLLAPTVRAHVLAILNKNALTQSYLTGMDLSFFVTSTYEELQQREAYKTSYKVWLLLCLELWLTQHFS